MLASVNDGDRSCVCGQNLCSAFVRLYWQPTSMTAIEQWWPTARQKHQGEFQCNYFDFMSLHHSNHDGVVRIFVGHSEVVKRYLIIYITRHNFSYTRSVKTGFGPNSKHITHYSSLVLGPGNEASTICNLYSTGWKDGAVLGECKACGAGLVVI